MRHILLASAAILGLAMAAPAFAQTATGARPGNVIGTGNSLPMSNQASNIGHGDTKSSIAPRLPSPNAGMEGDGQPVTLLGAAQSALKAGHTGMAQEALERAETRLLDRSTTPADAATPDQGMVIGHIESARTALGHGDKAGAGQQIAAAITAIGTQESAGQASSMSDQTMSGQKMSGQKMSGKPMSAPALRNKVGPAEDVGGGANRALSGGPLTPQSN